MVSPTGLHTGFFSRGGKFLKTILHVHATREGYTQNTSFTIYMYMYILCLLLY